MEQRSPLGLRALLTFSCLLTFTACGDEAPPGPFEPEPPSSEIQDALHGTGGNPFVFLKPPVVGDPPISYFGSFNGDLRLIVELCATEDLAPDGTCGTLLTTNDGTATDASYTMEGGPGGEAITVDLTEEVYELRIHFGLFTLADNTTYRVVTRVADRVLAFADLEVVSPQELRRRDSDDSIVFTNDNKTLPWKVRVDEGALCWEPDETVTSCSSGTVLPGQERTVTLTSSDGEEVDFHLPSGWSATVGGEPVDELTISIEELPADFGTADDPSCFANLSLSDPTTGEPSNCYDVRADTETESNVTVVFGGSLPTLSFCPDQEVLQAIANGADGFIMTSVETDAANAIRRTYANIAPPADFGGCVLPTQSAFGSGPLGRFANLVWQRVRPVMRPFLPTPLYAVDLGFGGEIPTLSTIFFWGRTPADLTVAPASVAVDVSETAQLSAQPVFHDGDIDGSAIGFVEWSSSNTSVATVDGSGMVTGVGTGTAQITATAPYLLDPSGSAITGSADVQVAAAIPGGIGTADVDGDPQSTATEWANAACFTVAMNLPDESTDPDGEFCFMNDGSNLYVRSTYTNTDPADPASTLFFELDMDGDADVAADPGDDNLGLQQSQGSALPFRDEVIYDDNTFANFICGSASCGAEDPTLGGVIDGAGAYSNVNGTVTFELSHPLNSGDQTGNAEPLDVALGAGDVIRVRFRQSIHVDANQNGTTLTDLITDVQILTYLQ